MKKIILISISLLMLVSCGPHRMKCGARGICNSPEKVDIVKPQPKPIVVKG